MSKKMREPREAPDLFSVAGLTDYSLPAVGQEKSAPPRTKSGGEGQTNKTFPSETEEASNDRYLRDTAVAVRYDISRQTVWRWAASGVLPEPTKLSEGITRWRLSALLAHEATLPKSAEPKIARRRRAKGAAPRGSR